MTVVPKRPYSPQTRAHEISVYSTNSSPTGISPAWFLAWKSYKNELPEAIGHWFTNAPPSAQLDDFWANPCQCWKGRNGQQKNIHPILRHTPTRTLEARSRHGCLRTARKTIQLELGIS